MPSLLLFLILQNILVSLLPLSSPIAHADFKYIASPFGWRIHPIHGDRRFHKGIDIVTQSSGAKVFATADGIIQQINRNPQKASGLSIRIKHAHSFQTYYAHLSKIFVQTNQSIKAGQVIGIIGATGAVTGVHLHYEIWWDDLPIDPLEVIRTIKSRGF